ncbi:hypothetical protein [Ornithinibacillus halotolerans]|uniref:Uncharacterized protein n=1 Tax=Ornithinibacillus halotolerans TaxID=1274357 RepID=A0A916RUD9_9BACI|nr:hypothetical protein [Ornithinibacillus halotolerans]GGA71537.1 hypothetical protein GCM10008025_14300 [Ornithinibacillus halotolerans]
MKSKIDIILDEKYMYYVQSIKDKLEAQSGSTYENNWLEFAFQVQKGTTVIFEMYEFFILNMINELVRELPNHEIKLLWLRTDHFIYYDTGDPHFYAGSVEMEQAVVKEIYSILSSKAEREKLPLE